MKKPTVLAFAALAALSTFGEPYAAAVPKGSWAGCEVRRERSGEILVMTPDKKGWLWRATAEPGDSDCIRHVAVTNCGDRLDVYTDEAFRHGMIKLVTYSQAFDIRRLRGKSCTLRSWWRGQGAALTMFLMGGSRYFAREFRASFTKRSYDYAFEMPEAYPRGFFRLDIREPAARGKPVSFYGAELDSFDRLPPNVRPAYGEGELLFYAPFDGTAEAKVAKGDGKPKVAKNLSFVPSPHGQALRLTREAKSALAYALKDNLREEQGTIMLWLKREWKDTGKDKWRGILKLAPEPPAERHVGSGRLSLWWIGDALRFEMRDLDDTYLVAPRPFDPAKGEDWVHVTVTWDRFGVNVFFNGRPRWGGLVGDSASILASALETDDPHAFDRTPFDTILLNGEHDGLVDELRIFSVPLGERRIRALYAQEAPPRPPQPDYAKLYPPRKNAYELPPAATPGVPEGLELVETVALDAAGVGKLRAANRFRSVGKVGYGLLDTTAFAETKERFAVRFHLETNAPLHCFEIDYPDDGRRTMDFILQDATCAHGDYTMQVGVITGGDYPVVGKIRTHRCLYWTRGADVAFIAMGYDKTAAAVSAIRVYRVKPGALPSAGAREKGGRVAALYFEDPSIDSDFSVPADRVLDPVGFRDHVERVAAYMKYCGLDTLCYPGAFYQGLIGDDYATRRHPRNFLSAYYEIFDREDLSAMPTVHAHNMIGPESRVSRTTMADGSLHDTVYSIHSTGKTSWGGWHGTAPSFNFAHPDVQANIRRMVMTLVRQGAPHPSFKGVVLHMTSHAYLWFGPLESGYNDYAIEAFERAKKVKVAPSAEMRPREKDPLRGKRYFETIMGDPALRAKWIDWRCETVTAFYGKLAAEMRAVRPDLKLCFNAMAGGPFERLALPGDDFENVFFREFGYDRDLINARIPNAVACRTLVPADHRKFTWKTPAEERHAFARDGMKGFYPNWKGAVFPWLNHHDRYWENAIGATGHGETRLSGDWLHEMRWRVSTLNPSGRNALRHFVLPLRVSDILGVSKGGFLMGFYGMEDVFAPFAKAFRALPCVRFDDLSVPEPLVCRGQTVDGRSWSYLANCSDRPVTVKVKFPRGTADAVSGERLGGLLLSDERTLVLDAWDFRSFSAPGEAAFPVVSALRLAGVRGKIIVAR